MDNMKNIKWTIFSAAAILAISQPVWAVTVKGAATTSGKPIASAYDTVERGGIVTSTNQDQKTIAVDGVSYPLGYDHVPIHSDGPPVSINIFKLKQGTKIRFNTVRDTGGQNRIKEIWVTKQDSDTKRSK
jgi:hypothetical protein